MRGRLHALGPRLAEAPAVLYRDRACGCTAIVPLGPYCDLVALGPEVVTELVVGTEVKY